MPIHRIRTKSVTGGGGGGPPGEAGFTDAFTLGINLTDTNALPTDDMSLAMLFPDTNDAVSDALQLGFSLTDLIDLATDIDTYQMALALADANAGLIDADAYAMALALTDSNADLSELVSLGMSGPDFSDSNVVPTDGQVFTMRIWLSGSAGSGITNLANANGQNNGTVATMQTALAGSTTLTMLSALGANVPSGVSIVSAIYRGWFRSVNTLVTSNGQLIMQSIGALFANVTMFANQALNTTVDRLDGSFTFDLVAAGIDTSAKLASCQMRHNTNDAVAGVTPHVLTVDAGCLELAAAF